MEESGFLVSLGWIVLAAAACGLLARRISLPPIVAYLVAGLLIGPVFGVVEDSPPMERISGMGITLLLFLVGLELSYEKIRDVGAVAVVAGLGQVVFTAMGGLVLGRIFGFGWMEALVIALALTFSSTIVAVKLLTDKGDLNKLYARIAVANSLVQTLVVIVVLTFLDGLGGDASEGVIEVLGKLLVSFGKVVVLLLIVGGAARFILPKAFGWAARSQSILFIWSLCWCFLVVVLAGWLETSVEVAALLAGLSLTGLPHNRDLQYRIKPLMNFFVAVFFVVLGAKVNLASTAEYWGPALIFSLFVLVGNVFIFMVLIPRFQFSEKTSFFAGVTGAQISEFSFIFASMGMAAGLVGQSVVSIIALVGLLTMGISSYMIVHCGALFRFLSRNGVLRIFYAPENDRDEPGTEELRGHILVVGMNSLGRKIAKALTERGERVVAIDTDTRKLAGLDCTRMIGSAEYLDVLLDAGLPTAKLLVSALRIEEANDLLAYRARQYGVPCCIQAVDFSLVDNLLDLDTDYLMLPKVDGVKLQVKYLKKTGILPE